MGNRADDTFFEFNGHDGKKWSKEAQEFIADGLGHEDVSVLTLTELDIIANLPTDKFPSREVAREIYDNFDRVGERAFIPLDNWEEIMGSR